MIAFLLVRVAVLEALLDLFAPLPALALLVEGVDDVLLEVAGVPRPVVLAGGALAAADGAHNVTALAPAAHEPLDALVRVVLPVR